MKICANCGASLPDQSAYCPACNSTEFRYSAPAQYNNGYGQQYDNGGYGQQYDDGDYGQQYDNAGYGQQYDNGGYGQQYDNGGYGQQYDDGGYGQQYDDGGYGQQYDNGGYAQQQYNNGGYAQQPQQYDNGGYAQQPQQYDNGVYAQQPPYQAEQKAQTSQAQGQTEQSENVKQSETSEKEEKAPETTEEAENAEETKEEPEDEGPKENPYEVSKNFVYEKKEGEEEKKEKTPGEKPNDIMGWINMILNTKDHTYNYDKDDIEKNKLFAIIAALGITFWVPFVFKPDSQFSRFYANQGLLTLILSIPFTILYSIFSGFVRLGCVAYYGANQGVSIFGWILLLIFFVVIMGIPLFIIINSILNIRAGKAKDIPLVGKLRLIS